MRQSSPKPRRRGAERLLGVEQIVDTALALVAESRLESVTLRDVAAALETGSASLYAWVPNRMVLNHLMLRRALEGVRLPTPDQHSWDQQLIGLVTKVARRLDKYPGLSGVLLGYVPLDPESLRITDRYLALMAVGGLPDRVAIYGVDLLNLYIAASSFEKHIPAPASGDLTEQSMAAHRLDRAGTTRTLNAVDPQQYPWVHRLARQLSRGSQTDRFAFGLETIVAGIALSASPEG